MPVLVLLASFAPPPLPSLASVFLLLLPSVADDRSRSFDLSRFSFFDFLPPDELAFSSYLLSGRLLLLLELARGTGDSDKLFGLTVRCLALALDVAAAGLVGRLLLFSLLRSRSLEWLLSLSLRFSSCRSCLSSGLDFFDVVDDVDSLALLLNKQ